MGKSSSDSSDSEREKNKKERFSTFLFIKISPAKRACGCCTIQTFLGILGVFSIFSDLFFLPLCFGFAGAQPNIFTIALAVFATIHLIKSFIEISSCCCLPDYKMLYRLMALSLLSLPLSLLIIVLQGLKLLMFLETYQGIPEEISSFLRDLREYKRDITISLIETVLPMLCFTIIVLLYETFLAWSAYQWIKVGQKRVVKKGKRKKRTKKH